MEKIITISCSECERLSLKIEELQGVVDRLESEISLLKGGKNSRTSSTAPSCDPGRSNAKSLRIPTGRKSGGQIGHAGHTLEMVDTPSEIVDHHPVVCQCCGESLTDVSSASFIRRQIVDIPPVEPLYIEHRAHMKICSLCSFENKGVFPEHVTSPIQYGAQIEAMVGYLSVYPYARITRLMGDFFKINLSQGSIDNFLANLSHKASSAYESHTLQPGSWFRRNVNGKKHWFHVWQTPLLTFIAASPSRGFDVTVKFFGGVFESAVYVSDCWESQSKKASVVYGSFAQRTEQLRG